MHHKFLAGKELYTINIYSMKNLLKFKMCSKCNNIF